MNAFTDGAGRIAGRNLKGQFAAILFRKDGHGRYVHAYGGSGCVLNIHRNTDSGKAVG